MKKAKKQHLVIKKVATDKKVGGDKKPAEKKSTEKIIDMLLLVGLGNPGTNSVNNRHNIGFKIIDAVNAHFKLSKKNQSSKDY